MGVFGWSYPPGAASDPYAPYNMCQESIDLTPRLEKHPIPGVKQAWWTEYGVILTEPSREPIMLDWDDDLSEAQNEVRAFNALRKARSVDGRRLSRVRGKLILAQAILDQSPVPSFDKFFADLAECIPQIKTGEDFRIGEDMASEAEWQPYFCSDCDAWHKQAIYPVYKREDGELAVEFWSCDEEGDHEWFDVSRRDDPNWDYHYRNYLSCYEHGLAWAEYHLWCAENDPTGDPCEDYFLPNKPITAERHLKDASSHIGDIRKMKRALSFGSASEPDPIQGEK